MSHYLGEVAAGYNGGRLVVDADLEAGGTPVDKLNRPLRLDRRDRRIHVLRDDVTAEQKADLKQVLGASKVVGMFPEFQPVEGIGSEVRQRFRWREVGVSSRHRSRVMNLPPCTCRVEGRT